MRRQQQSDYARKIGATVASHRFAASLAGPLPRQIRYGTLRRSGAFTLMDLMIATVVAALLAAIAVPAYTAIVERARTSRAIGEMGEIQLQIQRYRANNYDALPDGLDQIGMALTDPWGNPYCYLNIEAGANPGELRKDRNLVPLNTDFDLYSMGKDGDSKPPLTARPSRDDIVRANNGAFVGLAEDY